VNSSKKIVYGLILLTITLGAWARWRNLDFDRDDKRNSSPDEAMYTAYASVAAHEGIKGTAISVEQYNKNEKLWILPPPTRIGYLYPLAAVMAFTGRDDRETGLIFSAVVGILSVILAALLCLRFFDPWTAFFAALFMAVSPMELAFARKVWQDGSMTFLGGGLLYLSFEILNCGKKYPWITAYALLGAYAGLTKESGFVLLGLLSAGLVFFLWRDRRTKEVVFLSIAVSGACAAALALLTVLSGGPEPLKQLYGHLKGAVSGNAYALKYQEDSWYAFLEAPALLSPLALIFFAAGLLGVFMGRIEKRRELSLAAFTLILLAIAASLPAYFKNIRYLSPGFIAFYLLAAAGLKWLVSMIQKGKSGFIAAGFGAAAILLVVYADSLNFKKIFIEGHTKDLSNPLLRETSIFARGVR